jgi:subtilisin family serine protease
MISRRAHRPLVHTGWMTALVTTLALTCFVPAGPPGSPSVGPSTRAIAAKARVAPAAAAGDKRSVVVVATPGNAGVARTRLAALGGQVTRNLPLINGFAGTASGPALVALQNDPTVRSITPDTAIQVASDPGSGDTTEPDTTEPDTTEPDSAYTKTLGADQVWQAGDKGQGVTVAVIDTGVSASQDLSGRMVSVGGGLLSQAAPCKNLSGEPTCNDTYGHGTFVGGVIAGDGKSSGGTYSGVAPQAKLLSVKVAGASGASDVSNVLAAIQWVVSYRSTYNIRVLNLSLSTDSTQTYRTDPFNYAVERAWDAGIVVVVSASNRGPGAGTISKPADDPLVITVGATDDRGTPGLGDDELPDYSSRGPTVPDGLTKPDVVAPGSYIVSLRSPDSTIDQDFPQQIDGAYHRGSGTSFAAAATSGVVALMLARNPQLQPNQVKYALTHTADSLPASSDPLAVGSGSVDAAAAALNPPAGSANQGVVRSNGTGLLELSRGHVSVETTGVSNTVVNGGLTVQLLLWDPTGYLLGWSPLGWLLSTWALTPLLPVQWAGTDSNGRNWGGRNWGGGDWQGATWEGDSVKRDYGEPTDGALWFGAWG